MNIDTTFDLYDIVSVKDEEGICVGEIQQVTVTDGRGGLSEMYRVKFEHGTEDLQPEELKTHVCYLCGKPLGTIKKPYCHRVCAMIEARKDDMSLEGQEYGEDDDQN